jgi:hypothetical protein
MIIRYSLISNSTIYLWLRVKGLFINSYDFRFLGYCILTINSLTVILKEASMEICPFFLLNPTASGATFVAMSMIFNGGRNFYIYFIP